MASVSASALSTDAVTAIADALQQSLAETAVATMLAQNFHWNVTGMAFGPLHDLFGALYEDHFEAQDELAERIRAIGPKVDGTLASMVERSKVTEHSGDATDREMIEAMAVAEETIAATLSGAADVAAGHGDTLTEDLCIGRGREHEKFAWQLRSHLA